MTKRATQHKSNTPVEWEQAEGFSRYLISTDGQVYSIDNDKILKPNRNTVPTQYKVFFTLSLFCGFRKGETLALHWNDIDFKEKKISISKSVGMTENGFDYKEPIHIVVVWENACKLPLANTSSINASCFARRRLDLFKSRYKSPSVGQGAV